MLKSHLFHINSQEKYSRLQDQINNFLGQLKDDAVVSINTTEFGPAGTFDFYSYTMLVVYKDGDYQDKGDGGMGVK